MIPKQFYRQSRETPPAGSGIPSGRSEGARGCTRSVPPAEHPPGRGGDGEPTPAEPTRGMPDLVFPLVTHGKILVLQRPLGMMGVSAFVPRSPFFFFFLKDLWYENIWDPDLPVELASPEGISPPPRACVQGWLCKPRSGGCLGSSPVALPGFNFWGFIIFEWLLYNSGENLEGFHRPAPVPCVLVSARLPVPPAAPGPPQGSPQGLRHNPG